MKVVFILLACFPLTTLADSSMKDYVKRGLGYDVQKAETQEMEKKRVKLEGMSLEELRALAKKHGVPN